MDKIYKVHEEFGCFGRRANPEIYTDAIWTGSLCREHEDITRDQFSDLIADRSGIITLVDAVPPTYHNDYDLVITDNILSRCPIDYVKLYPEYWGTFSYNPIYKNQSPQRLFNCFIHRTDHYRQEFVYRLIRHDLLDQGYVSFHCSAYINEVCTEYDPIAHYQWFYDRGNLQQFAQEHAGLKSQIPFKNFSGDIDQTMADSRITVVLETYADLVNVIAFSEKIFRALQLPRPFVLYGCVGSIAQLRKHGFDVYDDLVDHSYDLVQDYASRGVKQEMIIAQIQAAKNFQFDEEFLAQLELRAAKNRVLLHEFRQRWPQKLERSLQAAATALERNSHKYSI